MDGEQLWLLAPGLRFGGWWEGKGLTLRAEYALWSGPVSEITRAMVFRGWRLVTPIDGWLVFELELSADVNRCFLQDMVQTVLCCLAWFSLGEPVKEIVLKGRGTKLDLERMVPLGEVLLAAQGVWLSTRAPWWLTVVLNDDGWNFSGWPAAKLRIGKWSKQLAEVNAGREAKRQSAVERRRREREEAAMAEMGLTVEELAASLASF